MLETAQAEIKVISDRLARTNPDWKHLKLTAAPLLEQITGPQRRLLFLLLGAVSSVLLIACVNVANLLLARSTARQHEIDTRVALGATRAHIVRFVLCEAFVLSFASSVAAVGIAYGGLLALQPLTGSLPRADELSVDSRVLLCSLAFGLTAALLFGVLPAVRSAKPEGVAGMRQRAEITSAVSL